MNSKHSRGFGLIESMLVLVLFGIVLVVVADLLNGYRALVRHSEGRGRTLKSFQIDLSQIRSDIRAATKVLVPLDGPSSVLQLERLSASLSPRLPATVPSTPASSWAILDPVHLYQINYRLDNERLFREIQGGDLVLASGLSDFKITATGAQYEISLIVSERLREFHLLSRVSRP